MRTNVERGSALGNKEVALHARVTGARLGAPRPLHADPTSLAPTRLRAHLKAAERGDTLPPRPVRLVVDVVLPGQADATEVYVQATPWPAHGTPRDAGYEPAHIEIERAEVGGWPLELDDDVRLRLEEAVAGEVER